MSIRERVLKPHIGLGAWKSEENSVIAMELRAGMEEENIPWEEKGLPEEDAVRLAYQCAKASPLGVGVAIGKDGSVAIHFHRLPEKEPLFYLPRLQGNRTLWRVYGSHAARLVKGLPFKNTLVLEDERSRELETLVTCITAEIMRVMSDLGFNEEVKY
ncbi:MAG: glycerol dehydratase reactivase beta/small subunit family protein [Bacillota bacterium]|jgi:hypothetical protein|uniref:Dehydratase n=1 Tax=Thermanaerosceptrum fracticalcis TaxID=1712410 RepID=A0A7G6E7F1_THEFR|nr:glycerol dehydratase reactivase beta/small subunit family protein [Thermanaerosceptrum fracticalcis]QNB48005.1 dehydratase [Thermanaerosceptrum fracticalcis]